MISSANGVPTPLGPQTIGYDDQLILTPERELALVDYEEVGPGDPMLDVGNFLAHLSWSVLHVRTKSVGRHCQTLSAGDYRGGGAGTIWLVRTGAGVTGSGLPLPGMHQYHYRHPSR